MIAAVNKSQTPEAATPPVDISKAAPLLTNQGLLPFEPTAEAVSPVPGVGNIAQEDVWEYFCKGGSVQMDAMICVLRALTESFPTATYLVNSTEELEPAAFQALKEPVPFTGEVAKVVSIGPLEQSFAYKGEEVELSEGEKCKQLASEVEEWLDAQLDSSVLVVVVVVVWCLFEDDSMAGFEERTRGRGLLPGLLF